MDPAAELEVAQLERAGDQNYMSRFARPGRDKQRLGQPNTLVNDNNWRGQRLKHGKCWVYEVRPAGGEAVEPNTARERQAA